MKRLSPIFIGLVAAFAVVLLAAPLQADIIWNLTDSFSGATPVGTLVVELEDTAPSTVKLSVDASALYDTEFVSKLYLNLDPTLDPTALVITDLGGPYIVDSINQAVDNYKADGDGKYDIYIEFNTSNTTIANRLGSGEQAEFSIVGGAGFDASHFEFLSAPAGGHGPFFVAAHVQGIGEDSGWVTDGNGDVPVPEASTLMLFGSGLIGILGFLRRKAPFLAGR